MRNPSLIGVIISAIFLAGIPIMAIASHRHIEAKDIVFDVPAQITPRVHTKNVDIWSDINSLDLDELTGSDNINRGDVVFVHMAKGPMRIAYPFAITTSKPKESQENSFAVRGKVLDRDENKLVVEYNFETFLPSDNLKAILHNPVKDHETYVQLAVNQQGLARLIAVRVDDKIYPYRIIEKPVLFGLSHNGASTMPMK